jgi:geranylgeranyl pyrophosphate synthase
MDLPGLCCEAASGSDVRSATAVPSGMRQQVDILTVAWRLLYVAAHVLDDIEDGDWADPSARAAVPSGTDLTRTLLKPGKNGEGAHSYPSQGKAAEGSHSLPSQGRVGEGLQAPTILGSRINIATGLIESASLALCDLEASGVDQVAASAIRREFHRTVLVMCAGQHADLTQTERTLEQCWQIAESKSGVFFSLACQAGARLVVSDEQQLQAFSEFGRHLGVLIQIRNDMGGLRSAPLKAPTDMAPPHMAPLPHGSDLVTAQRWTLPVAYALHVLAAPQCDQLLALMRAAPHDADAEARARQMVIESGALLYLVVEVERRRHLAELAMGRATLPPQAQAKLLALLNAVAGGEQ